MENAQLLVSEIKIIKENREEQKEVSVITSGLLHTWQVFEKANFPFPWKMSVEM